MTVATVSTIVIQYDNTAVTSYKTISANYTIPNGTVDVQPQYTQVPTDLIYGGGIGGIYERQSSFQWGTVFTDPYGVKYTSPTQVWYYDEVAYYSTTPSTPGGSCPMENDYGLSSIAEVEVYPSGKMPSCSLSL